MPKTAHSPQKNVNKNINPTHYGSDSDLNKVDQNTLDRETLLNITKRTKRKEAETPGDLCYYESKIDGLRESQENRFDTLTSAITTLIEQNKDIKNSLEYMSTKYDSLISKVETLERENQHYRTKVQLLEDKLESLETHLKSTSIVVRNIPKSEPETKQHLTNTIKNIISTIGSSPPLQELEVRDIYRNKSSAIVVDFTTTSRKVNFFSKFRQYNKSKRSNNESQLNTHNINLPGLAKPIYISDHHTARTGYLYFLAREQVKSKRLIAAWTSHGQVLVRIGDGEPAVRINKEEDLQKLLL